MEPAIVASRARGSASTLGIDRSNDRVYGCRGAWKDRVDRTFLHLVAEVHHHDVVGHLGDHTHVVCDQDHRQTRAPAAVRRISSRICACVVTSSAVVGSSAIRMRGSAASASAIITRWRSPPDSSNE